MCSNFFSFLSTEDNSVEYLKIIIIISPLFPPHCFTTACADKDKAEIFAKKHMLSSFPLTLILLALNITLMFTKLLKMFSYISNRSPP